MSSSGPVANNLFPSSFTYHPSPSPSTTTITTIDTHTGGEPLRIPISGLPPIHGSTLLAKRRYFMTHYDHIRTGLLLEPRGHADMYGAVLTTPSAEGADLDVFFLNTEGYSTMCGHAVLAIAKVVLETGILGGDELLKEGEEGSVVMNTPAGLCFARATGTGLGREVQDVRFRNVPSFVYKRGSEVEVSGVGKVTFDIAFGGVFYAIVDAASLGLGLREEDAGSLISAQRKIKEAIVARFKIVHPFEEDLSGLFGVIFTGKAHDSRNHSRNVTVFEDGEVDRSSTGTGVSARSALLVARGELQLNETARIESIVGSVMGVRVVEKTKFGEFDAVVPEVSGEVSITGTHELYFHKGDPYAAGFMIKA